MTPWRHALVLVAFSCVSCSDQSPLTPFTRADLVMGTTVEVTVYRPATDSTEAAADLDAALKIIADVDAGMSLYKADSELVALNAQTGQGIVGVSANLFDVLAASDFYATLSGGAFDVTIQPLVALWGFYDVSDGAVPSQDDVDAVLEFTGPDHMRLDRADTSVTLNTGSAIDLGGIAKGYAIELALAALRDRDVPAALVNLGGTIGVLGSRPDGKAWAVGLKHPRQEQLVGRLEFAEGAIATSGDYDRYFEVDGQRYSHLLDPRTGWPVDTLMALTVLAPTATAADALSTAAFILGPDEGMALIESCKNVMGVAMAAGEDGQLTARVTQFPEDARAGLSLHPTDAIEVRVPETADEIDCVFDQ